MQMQRFAARAQFLRSVAQLSVLNPRFLLRWLMGNSRYGTKLIKCWCRWLLKGQAYRIQEAILRNIELPNDEVPGVAAMLRYLYTGDYFDPRVRQKPDRLYRNPGEDIQNSNRLYKNQKDCT